MRCGTYGIPKIRWSTCQVPEFQITSRDLKDEHKILVATNSKASIITQLDGIDLGICQLVHLCMQWPTIGLQPRDATKKSHETT